MQERYKPRWAELKDSYERTMELLEEHLQQQAPQEGAAADAVCQERDRWQAIASQREHYVGEFERALWLAEKEYALLLRTYEELTEPKGKGRRRSPQPSRADRINALTDLLLRIAPQDQAKAKARQRAGHSPKPIGYGHYAGLVVGTVCGAEGLTQKQAVRLALMKVDAIDHHGAPRTPEQLAEHVERSLDSALTAYQRAVRTRKWRATQGT
jgi:hypothetical protein